MLWTKLPTCWVIRQPTVDDLVGILKIHNECRKKFKVYRPLIPVDTIVQTIVDPSYYKVVLEIEGTLHGFISGFITERDGIHTAVNDAVLVFHNNARTKVKAVKHLVSLFLDWADSNHCKRIEFATATGEWKPMQKLLSHFGAEQIGVVMEVKLDG